MFDYRQAELNPQQRALCEYAVRLTLAPAEMSEADVIRLRDAGVNDEQITIATQVIGYFNYINRIADGLGVDPEDWMTEPTQEEWERCRAKDYL